MKSTVNSEGKEVRNLVIFDRYKNEEDKYYPETLDKDSLKIYAYNKGSSSDKGTLLVENKDFTFEKLTASDGTEQGFKITLLGDYKNL